MLARPPARHLPINRQPPVRRTCEDGRMATVADRRATYEQAAEAFLELAATIPQERYDGPGLGDWDLRALVGHTARSFVTVTTYLGTRADERAVPTAAAYYAVVSRVAAADAD